VKKVSSVFCIVLFRRRRKLFVENHNINRLCSSGATLHFSTLLKLTGCAAGAGFALIYCRSYKQVTPLE